MGGHLSRIRRCRRSVYWVIHLYVLPSFSSPRLTHSNRSLTGLPGLHPLLPLPPLRFPTQPISPRPPHTTPLHTPLPQSHLPNLPKRRRRRPLSLLHPCQPIRLENHLLPRPPKRYMGKRDSNSRYAHRQRL